MLFSPLPSCLCSFYNHLQAQPESVGVVFGITVLYFQAPSQTVDKKHLSITVIVE